MKHRKHYKLIAFIICVPLLICSCSSRNDININERNGDIQDNGIISLPEREVKNSVFLEGVNVGGLKEEEVRQKIEARAQKIDIQVRDAQLKPDTWEVIKESPGRKVNIEKTLDKVLNAEEGGKVKLVVEEVLPSVTSEKLKNNIKVIASYTTKLIDKSDSRVNNIELASNKINGKIFAPGEEFSFNAIVGRRTEAKGYEEAPIIIKTEDGPKKGTGVGGGICQLSTTIYNAVEECGIEITERHLHSKNVGYVPKGEDATVTYGSADLKFRNNREYPIMIKVNLKKNSITVDIIENRNG